MPNYPTPSFFEQINVLQQGAKGDGVTDDTVAIQNAINTAGVGGTIIFPGNLTYIVSSDISLLSNQTVFLYGAILLAKSGTIPNIFIIKGTPSALLTKIKIFGGIFDGQNTSSALLNGYTQGTGIRIYWASDILIKDVEVRNMASGGIQAGDSLVSNLVIDSCYAKNNLDNGIFLRPWCCNVNITNCTSIGQIFSGIHCLRSDFVRISNCYTSSNGPASTTEGDGFGFEGCRYSEMVNCEATLNNNGGFNIESTTEGAQTGVFSWQGAYNNAIAYTSGQAVSFNGLSWYTATGAAAGQYPYAGSSVWLQSAFDGAGDGVRRFSQSIKLVGCRSYQNIASAKNGLYSASTTYSINQTVSYSGGTWVYINATPSAGNTPVNGTYWLGPLDNASVNDPGGIQVLDCNTIDIIGCTSDSNAIGYVFSTQSTTGAGQLSNVHMVGCTAVNNVTNGVNWNLTSANGASGNFILENCIIENNGSDGLSSAYTTTIKGGSYSGNGVGHFNDGIHVNGAAIFRIENAKIWNNTNNGIECNSYSATIDVIGCDFGNTATAQGRAVNETSTNSTTSVRRCKVRSQGNGADAVHLASATSQMDGTNDIDSIKDHNSGVATFSAATTATVTHGLYGTPLIQQITLTPSANSGVPWVTSIGATTFVINVPASYTGSIAWKANLALAV